jgi:mRNA interferase RelE/StbE
MRVARTERFKAAYRELTPLDKQRAPKAIRLLGENPRHPGLRVKKIKGTENIWEARVGLSTRMTLEIHGDLVILRNIGEHDKTLRKP